VTNLLNFRRYEPGMSPSGGRLAANRDD
jgi:hypothetical protein